MMFALPRGLSDHQRVSHGYPKLRCRVEGCGSEFLFRSKSDAHGRTHRAKTECDECGKIMYTSNLSTHKREVHKGEKPYQCKVKDCNMGFSRSEGLRDHGRIAHGFPTLKCQVKDCALEFSGYDEHRNHQRVHMRGIHPGDRPFGCNSTGCDKRYYNKTDLADHMRSVHNHPKLKCCSGQCTAEFVSTRGLAKMHQRTHHK